MFELDGQQNWVEAQPGEVVYLATSINRPAVAPPDRAPEAAQAYICTLRRGDGYLVFIYLHLISSNTGLLYRWSEGTVASEIVPSLQQSAQEFTESMGFMMDDLRFPELPPDQQADTFAQTPLFHQDISFLKPQDESVTELEIVESEEGGDEVVIEAVEDEAPAETAEVEEAPAAPVDSEVEEITLDVMTADEVAPGVVESGQEQPAAVPAEEEIALGGTLAEPAPAEEDLLLDQLEVQEQPADPAPPAAEPAPEFVAEPAPEPVAEAEPAAATAEVAEAELAAPTAEVAEAEAPALEVSVAEEESSALLDALEAEAEEAPPLPAPAAAEALPVETETVALAEETIEVPASEAPAAAPAAIPLPVGGGESAADENAFLISLLAMM